MFSTLEQFVDSQLSEGRTYFILALLEEFKDDWACSEASVLDKFHRETLQPRT